MVQYELHFSPDDIAKAFTELNLSRHKPEVICSEMHNILSPSLALGVLSDLLSHDEYGVKDGTVKNYFSNIKTLHMQMDRDYRQLFDIIQKDEFVKTEVESLSEKIYDNLTKQMDAFPVADKFANVKISKEQEKWVKNIDVAAKIFYHSCNRYFNSNSFCQINMLEKHSMKHLSDILNSADIFLDIGITYPIQTEKDYVANVLEPLILNVVDHAYNPENDLFNRLNANNFCRIVQIYTHPKKTIPLRRKNIKGLRKPVNSGEYVVQVHDNGFGITPESLEHLFEKGFSTKKDATMEHGIGMWNAKNFIEENGGKIAVKTKLGRGTTFEFTIPYSGVESGLCIQKR